MSTLLIDAGNSCLKWALADGDGGLSGPAQRHCYAGQGVEAVLDACAAQWSEVTEVWISSVLAEAQRNLFHQWFAQQGVNRLHFARTQRECCSVRCGYEVVEQLGIDRWLGVLAAHLLSSGDKLVIDPGTALTIDFLSADGQHQGGMIAPGMRTMLGSLGSATSLEAEGMSSRSESNEQWGKTTEQGVQLGVRLMLQGAIAQAIDEAVARSGNHPCIVLTGGDADPVLEWLNETKLPLIHRPNLVLEGLARYAAISRESETP